MKMFRKRGRICTRKLMKTGFILVKQREYDKIHVWNNMTQKQKI